MRDGILLYGKSYDYNLQGLRLRDYHDSKDFIKAQKEL